VTEIDRSTLQHNLLVLIETLPAVQVQNRLMSCTDRDLALAFTGMSEEAVDRILQSIAASKSGRVRDEIRLQKTRHVESRYSIAALRTIIASLESNRTVAGQRSYFRPRSRRDREGR